MANKASLTAAVISKMEDFKQSGATYIFVPLPRGPRVLYPGEGNVDAPPTVDRSSVYSVQSTP